MKGLLSAGLSLPPGHIHKQDSGRKKPDFDTKGEWARIAFMGVLLAAMVAFFWGESQTTAIPDKPPIEEISTPVPTLDRALLDKVTDDTRTARILVEGEVLLHLLEKSRNVVPTVAKALGMPAEPFPVRDLRNHPQRYRGQYYWYKGILDELPQAKERHFEARLSTKDGDKIIFAFSAPPPPELGKGSWVRVEGFFMKLRDLNFPELERAPMLVGPELTGAYDDWQPVLELDPKILAQIRDGKRRDGQLVDDGGDTMRSIDDSQNLPLWHVASFVNQKAASITYDTVLSHPKLVGADMFNEFTRGNVHKGKPVGLMGAFQQARTIEARPNPAGIEHWTEAWVQVREVGGRVIPIWIPKKIPPTRTGEAVMAIGYYFKNHAYTTLEESVRILPLFVAADLVKYELPENPLGSYMTIPVTVFLFALLLWTVWYARRDHREELGAEKALVDMKRRRRGLPPTKA